MAGIRSLIFDMDGVIIDSNPWHRVAWTEYNRKLGIETTEVMQQTMYGKRNDELIREFFGSHLSDEEVFAHGAAKEVIYRELMKPNLDHSLVPGIRHFLTLHRDLDLAVATNAEPPNVDFVLDGAGIRSLFRVVVNGHDVSRPKPDPEIYLRVAQLLEAEPASCVVFEDSRTGVEAGLAAGMSVVGVSTTHDNLAGVTLSVPDFTDPRLEAWLHARR